MVPGSDSGYDVTNQSERRKNLRRSESQLAEAQQLAHIGNWNGHPRGHDHMVGQMYRLFGLKPQDIEMTHDFGFQLIHPEDHQLHNMRWTRRFMIINPTTAVSEWRHSDGTYRLIDVRGQVIYDEANKPLRIFGTVKTSPNDGKLRMLRRSEERFHQLAPISTDIFG